MKKICILIVSLMLFTLTLCGCFGSVTDTLKDYLPTGLPDFGQVQPTKEPEEVKIFEKQYKDNAYYFQQGYPDDWTCIHGQDGAALRELEMTYQQHAGVLCSKFTSKNNDQVYTIYQYDTRSVIYTLEMFMKKAMETVDSSQGQSSFPFNKVFTETDESRDTYVCISTEPIFVNYSQKSWAKADFTFIKDAVDWKGSFCVATSTQAGVFTVIVWEAKADVWDTALPNFEKMMKDFYFFNFEQSATK